jgi:hypothetical protein
MLAVGTRELSLRWFLLVLFKDVGIFIILFILRIIVVFRGLINFVSEGVSLVGGRTRGKRVVYFWLRRGGEVLWG